MANPGYVRSADGDNADDGSTWALANATAVGAMADAVAGDRVWFSDAHAESTAAAITITSPGTVASPCQLLCGDDVAEPPTALATTGSIATTANSSITLAGYLYGYGLVFSAGSGGSAGAAILCGNANVFQYYESCDFIIANTQNSVNANVRFGSAAVNQEFVVKNCRFKFAAVSQNIAGTGGKVRFEGGSVIAGGTNITAVVLPSNTAGRNTEFVFNGFDFSGWDAGLHLIVGGATNEGLIVFRNCKLPASWSGSLFSAAPTNPRVRGEMYNCDAADTNYKLWIEDWTGSIRDETTIVRTGGASDGTTSLSRKMVTSANAEFPALVLRSPEISRWNETVGSAITVTVEVVHDSQGSGASSAFTDKEIWLEVQYLGTSGFPLSLFVDDAAADILATAADQDSSSETWTTTGLTTPVKQKLSVSFTPQEKGYIIATVCMAGASDTAYYCHKLTVA